jgi:DNA-directed RNA polymerase specialized sigma24 family protein
MSALERLRLALPDVAEAITEAVREEIRRQAVEYVTTEEAARRSGMSVRAVRHAASTGQIESKRVGRRLLVRL